MANYLVATSWDNRALCWDVQPNGQAIPKAAVTLEKPLLCSAWSSDGSAVFLGGCDNGVKMWNLATNQQQQVAQHSAPVRHCFYVSQMNMLITGSWDKTVKFWDLRSPNPVHTHNLPERLYAMDVMHPLMVLGTADRHIQVINLANPHQVYKQLQSPLKYQTRCLAAFPDQTGYMIGSIEGRVAVHHVEDHMQSKNFTFKCHRDGADVYAVNDVSFHPVHGTFATSGSDGAYNFWDKDSKQRLKAMAKSTLPIPCATFSRDGTIFAYAVSYDWSKGYADHNPATSKSHILLHAPVDSEVKGRARTSTGGRR